MKQAARWGLLMAATVGTLVVAALVSVAPVGASSVPSTTVQQVPGGVVALIPVPRSTVPCGVEYHNFPRTMDTFAKWSPIPKAVSYDVQIDCKDCRQVGKWDSEVGAPFQLNGVAGTNVPHSFQFWGDNLGRWRARAEYGTAAAVRPGDWGPWCEFKFTTGQQPPQPLGKPTAMMRPQCGTEYHNFPRVINMHWSAVAGAQYYEIEIDCFHCTQVGKWDSDLGTSYHQMVGPPPATSATNASHPFPGDNQGRWRVRAGRLMHRERDWGPWSEWCNFSFKTGQQPPTGDNKLPDITDVEKGFIIGGAIGGGALPSGVVGKSVAWNTAVQLTEADAFLKSNGQCAFNLHYNMKNIGPVATAPVAPPAPGPRFNNKWYRDATMVSQQTNLYLAAGAAEAINTQAYLTPGAHGLKVVLNDGFVVPESNTANNSFGIRYILEGKCEGPGPAGAAKQ